MIQGTPNFNGMIVFTINADFTKPTLSLTARAAFINTSTGATHGWTDGDGGMWSASTIQKLADLRAALEDDLGARHLSGGMRETPATRPAATSTEGGGIGESLSHEKVPSV